MPTIGQMCEHIVKADILKKKDGSSPTATDIWLSSPSGELWQVLEWYRMACEKIGQIPSQ